MQLFRILQSQGFGTRRNCRELIQAGRVALAQAPVTDPDLEYEPDGLAFTVDDGRWIYREKVYLVLNKPAGYECSRQTSHHPSIFSLLPASFALRNVQPVGRLDQDSTGLLLLSDDGGFIHRFTSPKQEIAKRYRVTCKHPIAEEQIAALLAGVLLRDEKHPIAARACQRVDERVIDLDIGEGKYHQVKRMLAAAGNRVEALERTRVGQYALPADLAQGQWRYLEAADLAVLATAPQS